MLFLNNKITNIINFGDTFPTKRKCLFVIKSVFKQITVKVVNQWLIKLRCGENKNLALLEYVQNWQIINLK